ncbi:hypothetical protein T4D_8605 [Trichinella pseudospiralis]|uniref:Uncharacterized protein n=1 Tax=Trichinella pseudospiralis TaxID=6337 RepID=A0A0V1FDD0_TRIPS|nr:hypothetical protein T4D_8605 [Trichinella pseudospiralis]
MNKSQIIPLLREFLKLFEQNEEAFDEYTYLICGKFFADRHNIVCEIILFDQLWSFCIFEQQQQYIQ